VLDVCSASAGSEGSLRDVSDWRYTSDDEW
jgi:hypothetical protein